jgi:hypothetical protein
LLKDLLWGFVANALVAMEINQDVHNGHDAFVDSLRGRVMHVGGQIFIDW